jgi:hypothetical protein
MAKELPYFKFEPNQWENGNIQICTHEEKGVYLDLCSMYWSRLGDLPYKLAVQKVCGGNATALDSLYDENIIDIQDGAICIHFLNEQLLEFENTSTQNSENARKGWEKRRKDKPNASALNPQSNRNAIREEKIREDKTKEDEIKEKKVIELFNRFWLLYDKNVNKDKCFKKFSTLKAEEMETLFIHVPAYVNSTPDKQYRKAPLVYLNNKSFNDEIITNNGKTEPTFKDKFFKGTTPGLA